MDWRFGSLEVQESCNLAHWRALGTTLLGPAGLGDHRAADRAWTILEAIVASKREAGTNASA
jgi:hypothetical protein